MTRIVRALVDVVTSAFYEVVTLVTGTHTLVVLYLTAASTTAQLVTWV